MCRKMASAGKCGDANCSFAHDINELRATKSFFKTTMCSFERRARRPGSSPRLGVGYSGLYGFES